MCNLIVSTTNNNEPMNRAVQKVAKDHLSGVEITEGLLNHVEVAIRAYDPCLSCATHAMGQMPLVVELVDREGQLRRPQSKELCETMQLRSWYFGYGNPGVWTTAWARPVAEALGGAELPGVTVDVRLPARRSRTPRRWPSTTM